MARGLYKELVQPRLLEITEWKANGLTDKQVASNLGIAIQTYYDYLKNHKELSEAVKKARFQKEQILENALFKSAVGYEFEEIFQEIKTENGKEKKMIKKIKKHYPSNVAAIIFYLKNLDPTKWKDCHEEIADTEVNIKVKGV